MALDSRGNIISEFDSYTYVEKEVYGLFNHPECTCLKGMNKTNFAAVFHFILFILISSQMYRFIIK